MKYINKGCGKISTDKSIVLCSIVCHFQNKIIEIRKIIFVKISIKKSGALSGVVCCTGPRAGKPSFLDRQIFI